MMQTTTINRFYLSVTLIRGGFGVGQAAIFAKSAWICCDDRQPSWPPPPGSARLEGLLARRAHICVDNSVTQRTAKAEKGNGNADIGNRSVQAGIAEAEFSNANAEFRNGKSLIGNAVSGL